MASGPHNHRLYACMLVAMSFISIGSGLLHGGGASLAAGATYLAVAAYHTYLRARFEQPEPVLLRIH